MTSDTDRVCGDWPAPCNCDDPDTHDGSRIEAEIEDTPTDDEREARKFAQARWPELGVGGDADYYNRIARARFLEGVAWLALRRPVQAESTDDERVDDLVRIAQEAFTFAPLSDERDGVLAPLRHVVDAILTALRRPVQGEPIERIEQAIAYIRASWLGTGEPTRNTPAGEIIAILRGDRTYETGENRG